MTDYKFRVRSKGESADEAFTVEAQSYETAAELYVENLCGSDSDWYHTNPHIVIVTLLDGSEATVQVDIDFTPSFSASLVEG